MPEMRRKSILFDKVENMIYTADFDHAIIYHNTKGETPEQIKAKTGCDTILNGMLFNADGSFCCKCRIAGKQIANDGGTYYGYGWNGNNLPVIAHSERQTNYDNYITSILVAEKYKRGRTAISFYNGKYTVLCVADGAEAMTIAEVEAEMKRYNSQILILDGGGSSYLDCPAGRVDATYGRKTANRMYICIWNKKSADKGDNNTLKITEPNYNWAYGATKRTKTDYIVLHHAAGNGTAEAIHKLHLRNGWRGIGYNYYVRKTGEIVRGREDWAAGGHTMDFNTISLGICFEGNFDTESMTKAQIEAGQALLADVKSRYPNAKIVKHSELNPTGCPGKNFPFDEIVSGETEETPVAEQTKTIYRVQVGAFKNKVGAIALKQELEQKGYSPFIVEVKQ